jgi:hypothetical protein
METVGQQIMKEGEIIVRKQQGTAPVALPDLEQIGADMERRIAILEKVQTLIQKRINPATDVKRIGDKFRRTINFARKCFRLVGGSITWWEDPATGLKYRRESYSDEQGAWFAMSVACTYVTPWGQSIEAFRRLTSREPFFGYERDEGSDEARFKDASDVNETDILEMAVTEAFKSAVFTALGFSKDIAPDEMGKFGVDGSKAAGHDFSGAAGRQGGSTGSQADKDMRAKIEIACAALLAAGWEPDSGEKMQSAADVLRAVTANPPKWDGWKSFRAIKDTQLQKILDKLNAMCDELGVAAEGDGDNQKGGNGNGERDPLADVM